MPELSMGEVLRYDDAPTSDMPASYSPLQELGSTGVKRATGIIDEEFLPALRGRKAIKVYKEMSLNDPMVGALLFTIDKLVRQVSWRVDTVDNTPEQQEAGQFIEECMDDMSHTWSDMVSEILSMLTYGWSWHEIVYKKRVGPWEKDPRKRSKYTDGRFAWRKIPIRSQETMLRWIFDDEGGIQGMVQLPPPYYKNCTLPIGKSLLFRTGQYKGNPEGQAMLRTAYRPWYFKKRLEEFEAIGVERDLAGMPVAKVPSSYMKAKKGTNEERVYQAFKRMVQNVRRDEHEGLVLPNEYDPETKQPLFEFELLSAGGSRTFDTNALIQRYEQRILMSCLADFILLGHEGTGSYAMHVDKTGIFRAALNVITESIADTFNRHAIPRLFELNGMKLAELPRLVPNNVDPPDLAQLAGFMTSMSGLGMQFFPDPDLEKFLRDTAHLPEMPEDMLEIRRAMAEQQNEADFAQSQMDAEGVQQKAEGVKAGLTPEQAEMAAQQPTEGMSAQEEVNQYKGSTIADKDPDVRAAKDKEVQGTQDQEKQGFQREQQGKDQDVRRQAMLERIKGQQAAKVAPKKVPPTKGK